MTLFVITWGTLLYQIVWGYLHLQISAMKKKYNITSQSISRTNVLQHKAISKELAL